MLTGILSFAISALTCIIVLLHLRTKVSPWHGAKVFMNGIVSFALFRYPQDLAQSLPTDPLRWRMVGATSAQLGLLLPLLLLTVAGLVGLAVRWMKARRELEGNYRTMLAALGWTVLLIVTSPMYLFSLVMALGPPHMNPVTHRHAPSDKAPCTILARSAS